MRRVLFLFSLFTLLTAFTCDNEPIDPTVLDNAQVPGNPTTPGNPNTPASGDLVGEWQMVSFDYNGSTTTTTAGVTIAVNFTGASLNENYTLNINADNTYAANGSYDIELTTEIPNFPPTVTTNTVTTNSSGTWTATATTFTTSGSIVEAIIDGAPQSGAQGTGGTASYTITNNGDTLTFISSVQETTQENGATIVVTTTNISVFNRVGGGNTGGGNNGGNNVGLEGTWQLTAWNAQDTPLDINNDGTSSTNLLDEIDCYNNETITFNANGTGVINNTSYADFEFTIVAGTTNQFEYTVDCIQDVETNNFTWTLSGNTVAITDPFGTTNWTLSGNELSILFPEGFIAFEVNDPAVTTSQDIIVVYTKQ